MKTYEMQSRCAWNSIIKALLPFSTSTNTTYNDRATSLVMQPLSFFYVRRFCLPLFFFPFLSPSFLQGISFYVCISFLFFEYTPILSILVLFIVPPTCWRLAKSALSCSILSCPSSIGPCPFFFFFFPIPRFFPQWVANWHLCGYSIFFVGSYWV